MFGGASNKTSTIACTYLLEWDRVLETWLLLLVLLRIKARRGSSFSTEYLQKYLDWFLQDVSESGLLYLDKADPSGTMNGQGLPSSTRTENLARCGLCRKSWCALCAACVAS